MTQIHWYDSDFVYIAISVVIVIAFIGMVVSMLAAIFIIIRQAWKTMSEWRTYRHDSW